MPELSGSNYSETDASNNNAAPNGMPEGMSPSGVNDAWRAGMGALKRVYNHEHGGTYGTVGGTANAITATYANPPTALVQGDRYAIKATGNNSGATTFTPNSGTIAATNVFKKTSSGVAACAGGEIRGGDIVILDYDGTQFQIMSDTPPASTGVTSVSDATNGGINVATGTTTPVLSLKPSDLLTKATPTTSDSVVIQDAAASNAAKTSTLAQIRTALGLSTVIVQDRKTTGTAGAALTTNAYTDRDLNTIILDSGSIASVSTPSVTLPAGTYDLRADVSVSNGNSSKFRTRLFDTTNSVVKTDTNGNDIVSVNAFLGGATTINVNQSIRARLTLAGTVALKFQTWTDGTPCTAGQASSGTGNSEPEVYLSAEFVKVA